MKGHYIPSSEVRLLNLLEATTVTLGWIQNEEGLPLTFVLSRGKFLRHEKFQLVKDGVINLKNDIGRALAIGRMDIVTQQTLLDTKGIYVKFVDEFNLWANPKAVKRDVLKFINT